MRIINGVLSLHLVISSNSAKPQSPSSVGHQYCSYTVVEFIVIQTTDEEDKIEKCQIILHNSRHTNFALCSTAIITAHVSTTWQFTTPLASLFAKEGGHVALAGNISTVL